jgi:PAS domain S-box-containing protein
MMGNVFVVERRGRREQLDPTRQIELRSLLESMPDAVIIVNAVGQILDCNGAASRISGVIREEMIGTPVTRFAQNIDEDPNSNVLPFRRNIAASALSGEVVPDEHYTFRQNGNTIELLISANPIKNQHGQILGALIVARDITELSQLQRRLSDVERHQAIGHVAAGIAHDFNNTLQTISQAVSVLQLPQERSAAERKIFLDMIQNAVRRGAEVIGRIRDYLRSGTAVPGEVDVRALLEDSVELTRPLWGSAFDVKLVRELHATPLVIGNEADLRRVFTNLIINGLQAMPNGGTLTVGCEEMEHSIHMWVRDTGEGISLEARTKIFNPYFTTKPGGTGLGLSGAQKILLGIGGDISFHTEEGVGTQFDVWLPKRK